jgi:hypothetical protein
MRPESPGCPRTTRGVSLMKCQGCGHDYPSTLTRCTHCRLLNPKRAQSSRLIEFPRKARATVEPESVSNPLPAWRQEVNERVRAAKARKNLTPDPAPVQETTQPVPEPDYNEANRYEKFTPRTGPITTAQRSTHSYTQAGRGLETDSGSTFARALRGNSIKLDLCARLGLNSLQ